MAAPSKVPADLGANMNSSKLSAVEKLKKAFDIKRRTRKVVLDDDGNLVLEYWITPLTIAQRSQAQKMSKGDDATDFALTLLIQKATDEDGERLFQDAEKIDLKRWVPASVVEKMMLDLLDQGKDEEDLTLDEAGEP